MGEPTIVAWVDDCEERDCPFPATRKSADGVPLCEGCYRKLCREWAELPEELREPE